MRDDVTTTPADAAAYQRAHGHEATPDREWADEPRPHDPRRCEVPDCWGCAVLTGKARP